MQFWTIFYWGWWIAWAPFVGMFIARISKGRTIAEVFNYSMTAPLLYVILWFSVFGGAGIKMHNTAIECKNQDAIGFETVSALGYGQTVCCPTTTKFRAKGAGAWKILEVDADYETFGAAGVKLSSKFCEYLHPQDFVEAATGSGSGNGGMTIDEYREELISGETSSFDKLEQGFAKSVDFDGLHEDHKRRTVYEFSYDGPANFFELLEQYYGWGEFLSGITIITIILYFVTSSDSGSFVVDLISAGGNTDKHGNFKDPHWLQRVLWSITEGALALGLMLAGGTDATGALRALSIAVGLPFTIVLCFMMPALTRMLAIEDGKVELTDYTWKMPIYGGFLDIFDVIFSFGGKLGGCPTMQHLKTSFVQLLMGFLPFLHASKTLAALDVDGKSRRSNMVLTILLAFTWLFWIVSMALEGDYKATGSYGGWFAFANVCYVIMAVILTIIRGRVREAKTIRGSLVEDFLCSFLFYFNVGPQCATEMDSLGSGAVGPNTAV
jgi:hypothetical protein